VNRHAARRRRRPRSDARAVHLFGAVVYALLLFGVNSWPGWESIPFLTDSAADVLWLVNLALVLGLLAQMALAVDDTARVRAVGVYCVALVTMALVGSLLELFPFDLGGLDPSWTAATRLVLSLLLVWAGVRAIRAAVRLARGRQPVHLAAGHA
jgi:hypothetical protein